MFVDHSALVEGSDCGEAWQRLSSAVEEAAPAQVAWHSWGHSVLLLLAEAA